MPIQTKTWNCHFINENMYSDMRRKVECKLSVRKCTLIQDVKDQGYIWASIRGARGCQSIDENRLLCADDIAKFTNPSGCHTNHHRRQRTSSDCRVQGLHSSARPSPCHLQTSYWRSLGARVHVRWYSHTDRCSCRCTHYATAILYASRDHSCRACRGKEEEKAGNEQYVSPKK